jgi:type IV pilus assembly protein PilB
MLMDASARFITLSCTSTRIGYAIDGELREIVSPPIAIKDKLGVAIKVISRVMGRPEKRVPQDGRNSRKVGPDRN